MFIEENPPCKRTKITVFLEPTKTKATIELNDGAVVGHVVQGLVAHLRGIDGFDLESYIDRTVGDRLNPEWQLFREREAMQLLPPGAIFDEIQPPIEDDEPFTIKVNAKVAGPHAGIIALKELLEGGEFVVDGQRWRVQQEEGEFVVGFVGTKNGAEVLLLVDLTLAEFLAMCEKVPDEIERMKVDQGFRAAIRPRGRHTVSPD